MFKTIKKLSAKLLIITMMFIGLVPTTAAFASSTVKVTGITLNQTRLSIAKGNTSTLTTTVSPSNASNTAVKWKSSNEKVATVNSNGKITAVKNGTAIITCTAKDGSNKKVTCKVTVTSTSTVKVTGITLNQTSLSIVKGNTATLTATVSPSNASNTTVRWKSSDEKVAKVNSNGKITALKKGTATITCIARDGSNKKATCKVTVTT
ncbi:Ig-like domain-containing protein [Clostridium sp.]|uniref:Ig-like domain-containing protein n=1 Tax=Clostridium sp. TaxID=1506 RepID=UPI00283FA018|nr:Ig-like domain-containing protein [Clostridium sp.]MDR3596190.1 Ig-like domain-containing protein [Clostridium sp.]